MKSMRTRKFVMVAFALCLIAVVLATFTEPRLPVMGKFIWPGAGLAFLIFLLLRGDYFGHPMLVTFLDVLFNAALYTAAAAILWRLVSRGSKRPG